MGDDGNVRDLFRGELHCLICLPTQQLKTKRLLTEPRVQLCFTYPAYYQTKNLSQTLKIGKLPNTVQTFSFPLKQEQVCSFCLAEITWTSLVLSAGPLLSSLIRLPKIEWHLHVSH